MLKKQIIYISAIALAIIIAVPIFAFVILPLIKGDAGIPVSTSVRDPIAGEYVETIDGVRKIYMFEPVTDHTNLRRLSVKGAADEYAIIIELENVVVDEQGGRADRPVYYLEGHTWAPVNQSDAATFVTNALSGGFIDLVVEHCANYGRYGFYSDGTSDTWYSFETTSGRIQTVYFGSYSPDERGYYTRVVRDDGADAIYRIGNTLVSYVNRRRYEMVMPLISFPMSGATSDNYLPKTFAISDKSGLVANIVRPSNEQLSGLGSIFNVYLWAPELWKGNVSDGYLNYVWQTLSRADDYGNFAFTGFEVVALGSHSSGSSSGGEEEYLSDEALKNFGITLNYSYEAWRSIKEEIEIFFPKESALGWSQYYENICVAFQSIAIADLEYAIRQEYPFTSELAAEKGWNAATAERLDYNKYINGLLKIAIDLADDEEADALSLPPHSLYWIDFAGATNAIFASDVVTDVTGNVRFYNVYFYNLDMVVKVKETVLDVFGWDGSRFRNSQIYGQYINNVESLEIIGHDSATKSGVYGHNAGSRPDLSLSATLEYQSHTVTEGEQNISKYTVSYIDAFGERRTHSSNPSSVYYTVADDDSNGPTQNTMKIAEILAWIYDQGALDKVLSPTDEGVTPYLTVKVHINIDGKKSVQTIDFYNYGSPSRLSYAIDGGNIFRYVKTSKVEAFVRSVWHVLYNELVEPDDEFGIS